jgi:hypothetical protein
VFCWFLIAWNDEDQTLTVCLFSLSSSLLARSLDITAGSVTAATETNLHEISKLCSHCRRPSEGRPMRFSGQIWSCWLRQCKSGSCNYVITHQAEQLLLLRASYICYLALCSMWLERELDIHQVPETSRPEGTDKCSDGSYVFERNYTFSLRV